jgi:hypothetical protein
MLPETPEVYYLRAAWFARAGESVGSVTEGG